MRCDANPSGDIAPYVVGDQVWKPGPRLPGVGYAVSTLMQRGFVVPALFALVALLGLSLLRDDDLDDDLDGDVDDDVGRSPPGHETFAAPWPPPRVLETASR